MVYILSMALLILGASLFAVSLGQASRTIVQEKREQAFYIAKSGADAIAAYIIDNYNPVTLNDAAIAQLNNNYLNQDISFGNGVFRAEVRRSPSDSNAIIINSKGTAGNISNRTTLTLGPDGPIINMNHVILAEEDITADGSSAFFGGGDIAAGKSITGIGAGNLIEGGTLQPGYEGVFPPEIPFPNISGSAIPLNPGTVITQSANYGNYELQGNNGFSINVIDRNDIHIIFNHFKPNGTIDILGSSGTGAIHIYANSIEVSSPFSINNLSKKTVILHVKNSIHLNGSFTLNGVLLYAPTATYTYTNGAINLTGAMITKNLQLVGSNSITYDRDVANFINATRKFERHKWSGE
ncbi:DUF7305 domain-containing protein [Paenibacillus ihumii]|uniref:DUF7305 domain-containing protein n=1 Tax=Paenibacillus ihumii TaxID=687436 RepID=UPI000AFBB60E|nr:hypothetical protein [Paenibacillus ihumii]